MHNIASAPAICPLPFGPCPTARYTRALRLRPAAAVAHSELGRALMLRGGRRAQAVAAFRAAVAAAQAGRAHAVAAAAGAAVPTAQRAAEAAAQQQAEAFSLYCLCRLTRLGRDTLAAATGLAAQVRAVGKDREREGRQRAAREPSQSR